MFPASFATIADFVFILVLFWSKPVKNKPFWYQIWYVKRLNQNVNRLSWVNLTQIWPFAANLSNLAQLSQLSQICQIKSKQKLNDMASANDLALFLAHHTSYTFNGGEKWKAVGTTDVWCKWVPNESGTGKVSRAAT
jgi:hypothetical protein